MNPGRPVDVVLIHGWAMHPGMLAPLAGALGPGVRAHLPALPGHGGRAGELAPDPAALARLLLAGAPERAVWCGWSLGGLIALWVAAHCPGRVLALCQIATSPCFVARPGRDAGIAPALLADLRARVAADPAAGVARFLALASRGEADARGALRRLRASHRAGPAPDPRALAAGLELLAHADLYPELAALRVPSLWLFGSGDAIVPARSAAMVAAAGEARVIEDAGHAPFLGRAGELGAILRHWLEDQEVSTRGP